MNLVIPMAVMLTVLFLAIAAGVMLRERFFVWQWARRVEGRPAMKISARINWKGFLQPFLELLDLLGNAIKPKEEKSISRIRMSLIQAGYWGLNVPGLFHGAKIVLTILLPALLLMARLKTSAIPPQLYVVGAVAGFYLPNIWLRWQIAKRREKILKGLPDALDLLVVCTEAGLGLDSAINKVSEKIALSNRDLGNEFRLVMLEQRAGKSRYDALKSLARRVNLEDMNNLVTMLIQTDRFGTGIAQALKVHAESARTRRQQRAEEMANKMPTKLTFPLVMFIFPSIFVVLLGPAVIKFLRVFLPAIRGIVQ
jgi:tight adherence protein C